MIVDGDALCYVDTFSFLHDFDLCAGNHTLCLSRFLTTFALQKISPIFSLSIGMTIRTLEISDMWCMKVWRVCITRWSLLTCWKLAVEWFTFRIYQSVISLLDLGNARAPATSTSFLIHPHSWRNTRLELAFTGWSLATRPSLQFGTSTFRSTARRTLRASGDFICICCSSTMWRHGHIAEKKSS